MTDFTIEMLQPRHREDVLQMIAVAFTDDDSLARSQGIDVPSFRVLIDGLYPGFLDSRLSHVARDRARNRIAAVVLADAFEASDEGSDAIAAIIDRARQRYIAERSADDSRLAHIHFIASSRAYRRHRLVHQAVDASLQQARNQRFDRIVVEASGIPSRTFFEKHFGFESRVVIDYRSFEWKARYPFASIAEHGGLTLMDLEL